jgi:methyl-accepting chemotaxis protein
MPAPSDLKLRELVRGEIQDVLDTSESATLALGENLDAIVGRAEEFVKELQGSVGVIGSSGEGSVAHVLNLQSVATDAFVRELNEVTSENATIAERVTETTQDVSKVAQSVSDVASQARMLCFNTKIEAGRLGDQGRPFMVIADQMRELSDAVAESNDRISELVQELSPLLDAMRTNVHGLRGATADFTVQHQGHREEIGTVSHRLQEVTSSALGSGDENLAEIIGRSSKSLEALQTQDIIAQKLRKLLDSVHMKDVEPPLEERFEHAGFVSEELPGTEDVMGAGEMEMF